MRINQHIARIALTAICPRLTPNWASRSRNCLRVSGSTVPNPVEPEATAADEQELCRLIAEADRLQRLIAS